MGSSITYNLPAILDPDLLQTVTYAVVIPSSTPVGLITYLNNIFTINAL